MSDNQQQARSITRNCLDE